MTAAPVPIRPPQPRRGDWSAALRILRWNRSRGVRRASVVAWLLLLTVGMFAGVALADRDWLFALLLMLILGGHAWWAIGRIDQSFAQPTIQDRALMEYGEEFDALPEAEQNVIFRRQLRDGIVGVAHRDERETDLRAGAESQAYRSIRLLSLTESVVFWVRCLDTPAPGRTHLAQSSVAITAFTLVVWAMPSIIRMWNETSDATGEPKLVATHSDES